MGIYLSQEHLGPFRTKSDGTETCRMRVETWDKAIFIFTFLKFFSKCLRKVFNVVTFAARNGCVNAGYLILKYSESFPGTFGRIDLRSSVEGILLCNSLTADWKFSCRNEPS